MYSVHIGQGNAINLGFAWGWLVTVYGPNGGEIDDRQFYSEDEARDWAREVVENAGGDTDDIDWKDRRG